MAAIVFIDTALGPAGPARDQTIAFRITNSVPIQGTGISIRYLRDPNTYVVYANGAFTVPYADVSTVSNPDTAAVTFTIAEFGNWRGEILAIEAFGIDALGVKFVETVWDHRAPFVQLAVVPSFSVPRTVDDYTSIGFPAPTYIWDMQVAARPIPELLLGEDMDNDTGGSTGLVFEVATTLPNNETSIQRTTSNTSRQKITDTAVLDVGTDQAVAIGMMFKVAAVGGTNVLAAKRPTTGWDCRLNSTGRMWLVTSDDLAASVSLSGDPATELSIGDWHYGIWVIDHRTAVKELKIIDEIREKVASSAGLNDLSAANGFGWDTTAYLGAVNEYAAMAAWTGADVQLLTSALAQAFLDQAGA